MRWPSRQRIHHSSRAVKPEKMRAHFKRFKIHWNFLSQGNPKEKMSNKLTISSACTAAAGLIYLKQMYTSTCVRLPGAPGFNVPFGPSCRLMIY
ncbi:hypothetical protein DAPPUDRAFT_300205 [Daphnia pulex]|uniref:Uncharacterized protein n=1 Tax=Daphnia pulex TaxID=6669 RepID=E9G5A4_DAPPU|nr:hypothetical protein DAPPUDRAFT_300205 [Daphnia pulex]|eukprot:EFX85173.1 hypothetical protein DAPPUDRAFT_300205 [Daphnia pulex]